MYNLNISADPNKATQTYAQYTTHYNTKTRDHYSNIDSQLPH